MLANGGGGGAQTIWAGGKDSLELIPGLLKSMRIRAQSELEFLKNLWGLGTE